MKSRPKHTQSYVFFLADLRTAVSSDTKDHNSRTIDGRGSWAALFAYFTPQGTAFDMRVSGSNNAFTPFVFGNRKQGEGSKTKTRLCVKEDNGVTGRQKSKKVRAIGTQLLPPCVLIAVVAVQPRGQNWISERNFLFQFHSWVEFYTCFHLYISLSLFHPLFSLIEFDFHFILSFHHLYTVQVG
jgi:hypothetical protein